MAAAARNARYYVKGSRHVSLFLSFFFFNDTATTEIYTLSLHDALPICNARAKASISSRVTGAPPATPRLRRGDRKSTRLNSSHSSISYAVFCLKKKNTFDFTVVHNDPCIIHGLTKIRG